MPLSSRVKRIALTTGMLVVLIAGLIGVLTPVLLERWLNNYDLQSAFHKATGGTISTGAIRLGLFPAPHLTIPSGVIDLPDFTIGRWQKIRIQPALTSIFSEQVRFKKLKIIAPDFQLNTRFLLKDDQQPVPEAMDQLTSERLQHILLAAIQQIGAGVKWLAERAPDARVDIRQGRLHLIESAVLPPLAFHAVDARLQLPSDVFRIELDCQSSLFKALRVAGEVDAATLVGQLTMWFNSLDARRLADIAGPGRSLARLEGQMSGHATVDLKGGDRIESHLSFRLPQLLLQRLETPVTIQNVFMDGTATFDKASLRLNLDRLYAEQPKANLTGHFQMGADFPGLRLHLVGSRIDIAEARRATLALVGDHPGATKIFDVLRAGSVPWISWRTEGPRLGDLGAFRNMKLTGEVQSGELYIPAADLSLTEVNGIADIDDGVLRGEGLSAREQTAEGRDGRLWLDFKSDDIPFFLEIDTHLKDVGILPPRLLKWVQNDDFQSEIKRLSQVRGEARGMLILDSRKGAGLEVTADVAQCRLAAEYERLPWEVHIDSGLVVYTNDRITLDRLNGRIGSSTFGDLKARVDFDGDSWLHIESARAAVDLEAVIPWLMTFEALSSAARQYRLAGDTAEIASLSLKGPFFDPSRWAFTVQGRIDRLALTADDLPGPLNLSDLRLSASEHSLNAASMALDLLDADGTGRAQATFAARQLESYSLEFKGELGPRTDQWLNDLFEKDTDFFLWQTPLTVTAARINWAAGKPHSVNGDFTTSQGVRVSFSQEWEPGLYRKERAAIQDGEALAIITRERESDQLTFGFEGLLTSKTLDRLLLKNPFPSGRLRGDFQIGIVKDRPELSTTSGHLTAVNIRLPLEGNHKIHISQLQLSAEDNRLQIAPAAFLVNDSWHTLEGDIRLASTRYSIDLQHEGAFLSVPAADEPPSENEQSQIEWLLNLPIDGKIQSRLSALKWGEHRWVPMKTT
ncbi:MAG: hypothetical protein PVF97_02260, partial [Desulfobacterales bacterium]